MKTKGFVSQFLKERTEALLSMNRGKIVAYYRKYGEIIPKSEEVFWAGVHHARIALKDLPNSERMVSAKWLEERGFNPLLLRQCRRND
jgi:hypothetical protein